VEEEGSPMGGGPNMSRQVRLTVYQNESLARLAEQRLNQQLIGCVVRSLGAGSGGLGVATNLPHALYVLAEEEMRAREVLNIPPAEIAERETRPAPPLRAPGLTVVGLLVIAAAVLILGIQVFYTRILS
jgi:hypothetical protein